MSFHLHYVQQWKIFDSSLSCKAHVESDNNTWCRKSSPCFWLDYCNTLLSGCSSKYICNPLDKCVTWFNFFILFKFSCRLHSMQSRLLMLFILFLNFFSSCIKPYLVSFRNTILVRSVGRGWREAFTWERAGANFLEGDTTQQNFAR